MNYEDITFTVGIPTYYGGESLVRAVDSILASESVGAFEIIITVDGNPLEQDIREQLKKRKVTVIENKKRGGQVARIKQLISLAKTEVIILTQDDILFEKHALLELLKGFVDKRVTMVSGKVVPLKATNLMERIIQVGVSISYTIGRNWENSDNYFLAGGRCLAFRTSAIKKFMIPVEVLNSDTYLYFENKKRGGIFRHMEKAVYYMRSPKKLSDHLKQSKKYQFVPAEIKNYLNIDIHKEQPLTLSLQMKALFNEALHNPYYLVLYMFVMVYTRFAAKNMYSNAKRFWDTDKSTKEL